MTDLHAVLALADGTVFRGRGFGAPSEAVGELVFNTAMSGYQEILTDPSYYKQLVTLTYPHIGNTGINPVDAEADRIYAAGLIIRDLPRRFSNFRALESLSDYLLRHGVGGISEIDTRKLTRILREGGAQSGALVVAASAPSVEHALALARGFVGLDGLDLVREITIEKSLNWREGSFDLGSASFSEVAPTGADAQLHVVAYDFGIKRNILRMLTDRGCRVTLVPASTTAAEVFGLHPDGVFLSNGPGDPAPVDYAIAAIQTFIEQRTPLFGICLGHQLLGLAAGANTLKMKFGHHGANHPVQDLSTGAVMISSQNHGFAVDEETMPAHLEATHRSLFDGSLQGIRHRDAPAYSFQGHPEASPGPHDVSPIFDPFIQAMSAARSAANA